ncbi:quinone-dependent dihydroorotate dehydrogenase [Nereida sp. MMG025]|uniref:quinone-dependent dihydroorotate dehydrogenase n=1 Tax=Nereida sp. MMG025 TaxID=2909981 RepID=UPI001EFF92F9|nr:quinone-dependent dihydroorotate dehydrogenase [Nereida sp. MMG025]MCF6443992.1 quinone-dependent dihydroorotate dehydrogenase [Nereida sp. MMG025]
MSLYEKVAMRVLRSFDSERAHGLAIKALNAGLSPLSGVVTSERLRTTVAGLEMPNPVGLAAGFDKNAQVVGPLQRAGFGFLEVGAATPRPQAGNPKPRLFRLHEDHAVINRFGFNNEGMEAITTRLAATRRDIPIGLNLGANKDSADRAEDYRTVLRHAGAHVDFATVNVSSPNTEKLRDLQGKDALQSLLAGVLDARDEAGLRLPIFVKIAPDLSASELADVAEVAAALPGLDGIIATNTTLMRDGLKSAQRGETGGLSGQPLFEMSTRVLAQLSGLTDKPIIGVGGVASAEQAYAKIKAGASAVQLYSGLVYGGLSLAADIARGLDDLLARDGFASVADAIGTDRSAFL